ncbi:MAG: AAA family ATPase [Nitrosopumilus sp.]|nr:AAA family ATPase [Nitrosopumilus sp.]MDA7942615.1 AAA family ATPase [Nitrosopumilus sp.]
MRITIKDFGPVAEGEVDLMPLTIFVGPNDSGKSYVATLVHSIMSAENEAFSSSGAMGDRGVPAHRQFKELCEKVAGIVRTSETPALGDFLELQEGITGHIQGSFDDRLETSITGNFGSDLPSLVRTGQDAAKISVDGGFSALLSDKASVTHARNTAMNPDDRVKLEDDLHDIMDASLPKMTTDHDDADLVARRIVRLLAGAALESARIDGMPSSSFYLPAARSGLIQGHKALSAALIQNSRFAGAGGQRTPGLNGIASGFIAGITMLEGEPGELHGLGEEMEVEILGGRMDLRAVGGGLSHEIFYSTDTSSIPLHRTSSTISEVSALSLYLKHVARPGSLLIIEEPEAHLHLKNRAAMARYIVRMVRSGLRVLVITHSSAIVEGLGKHMLAGKAAPEKRREAGIPPDDWLEYDEVAPYVFEGSKESGYRIREITKDVDTGIPHDDYMDELQDQYNSAVKLEHILASK